MEMPLLSNKARIEALRPGEKLQVSSAKGKRLLKIILLNNNVRAAHIVGLQSP